MGMVKDFHMVFGSYTSNKPAIDVPSDVSELRRRLIKEEATELDSAIAANDMVGIADGIADLLYVVFGTAVSYGIPIDNIFQIVHEANMSKVGSDGKPLKDAGGKVVKPQGWVSPNQKIACILQQGD